jgi:hypothetical protein
MPTIKRILGYWLPLAVVATGLCFFTYVAVQQNYRMNANDPQIEMAQNAVVDLENGISAKSILPTRHVDIASSLSPFMIIYDKSGMVIATTAKLNGITPTVPEGVLTSTLSNGENRVTWQPEPGVRVAAVVDHFQASSSEGYVLVGRSLSEVEARINNLTLMLTLTWACALIASLILIILAEYFLVHPREK